MTLPTTPLLSTAQMELHRLGLPVAVSEKVYGVITGKSVKRIQNDRLRGVGIRPVKDGRSIRYLLADILAELERNRRA